MEVVAVSLRYLSYVPFARYRQRKNRKNVRKREERTAQAVRDDLRAQCSPLLPFSSSVFLESAVWEINVDDDVSS